MLALLLSLLAVQDPVVRSFHVPLNSRIDVKAVAGQLTFSARPGNEVQDLRASACVPVHALDFTISGEVAADTEGWEHVSVRMILEEVEPYGSRRVSESLAEIYCGNGPVLRPFHRTIRFSGDRPDRPLDLRVEVYSILWKHPVEIRNLRLGLRAPLAATPEGVDAAIRNLGSDDLEARDNAIGLLRRAGETAVAALKPAASSKDENIAALARDLLRSADLDRTHRLVVDMSPRPK